MMWTDELNEINDIITAPEEIVRNRYVATDCCRGIQISAKYVAQKNGTLLYFCLHHKRIHEPALVGAGWSVESILDDNPYEKAGQHSNVYHVPGE